jgi:CDP-diacylglycerol--glycerol-3-phosphate 3-phosphatidyltransferase
MRAANAVTLGRILAIPLFIIALYLPWQGSNLLAAGVFFVLALSDMLDGWLARKLKQTSEFGALLDPVADKLLVAAGLVFLIGRGVPAWIAFVILAREFIVTGFRLAVRQKVVVSASALGKLKTWSQSVAILAVLLGVPFSYELLLLAVTLTVISGLDYLRALWPHIAKEI